MGAETLPASEEKGGVYGRLLPLWGMDKETFWASEDWTLSECKL